MISVVLRFLADALELLFELFQVLVRKLFKIDKFISRALDGANDLIEFQMDCFGVTVLRVLNEEDHKKSHNGRSTMRASLVSRKPTLIFPPV